MDLVVRARRFPRPGETVRGSDLLQLPGGKGANQAVAAARAGGRVLMAGAVGRDAMGRELLRSLRRDRVDVAAIRRVVGIPTGVALITLDPSGENHIVLSPGANGTVDPARIEALGPQVRAADIVLLQHELPLRAVRAAIRMAHEERRPVVLNPAPAEPVSSGVLKQIEVLVLNETEAERIGGQRVVSTGEATRAVDALASRVGGGLAVLTLGERGSLVAFRGEVRALPAYRVTVRDTTAAGDAFVGAFAVSLLELGDPFAAARFASAAAALAVTRVGAQVSLPARSAVESLLRRRGT